MIEHLIQQGLLYLLSLPLPAALGAMPTGHEPKRKRLQTVPLLLPALSTSGHRRTVVMYGTPKKRQR